MSVFTMVVSAGAIIALVRFGLCPALDHLGGALRWSAKTRGQATGFATSSPEFVALVAAGLAGVWEAGLWNIAASNIINTVLMLTAAVWYRQAGELRDRRFRDELLFAGLAVVVPIGLMVGGLDTHWAVVPGLLAFFVLYRIVDRRANPSQQAEAPAEETVGHLPTGLILGATALSLIAVAGMFLGDATQQVVHGAGIPLAAAGWILGIVTSLPEMVTFFAVYGVARKEGTADGLEDTQEVLDNLTASNVANTGIVYPIGLAVFLIVTAAAG